MMNSANFADGGGIRGFSTLLILKNLMEKIADEERQQKPSALSSAFPYDLLAQNGDSPRSSPSLTPGSSSFNKNTNPKAGLQSETAFSNRHASSQYLPCHYFDYIAGTSTGGYVPESRQMPAS
jgi:hypothetical protein